MTKKRQPSTKKREAILSAAMAEFHSTGFAGTSMDRIAEQAHVSKRTVYNYFESKENLFLVVLQNAMAKEPEIQMPEGDDARAHIRSFVLAVINVLDDKEHLATMRIVMADIIRNPKLSENLLSVPASKREKMELWLRKLNQESAQIEIENLEAAGIQFISLIHGFFLWPKVFFNQELPPGMSRESAVDEIVVTMMARYGVKA